MCYSQFTSRHKKYYGEAIGEAVGETIIPALASLASLELDFKSAFTANSFVFEMTSDNETFAATFCCCCSRNVLILESSSFSNMLSE